MTSEREPAAIQSVERAFGIVELIAASGQEVGVSELAERAALPLPTMHRFLRTLVSLGYVRQLSNRRYALGPGLIRVGEAASLQMGAWARPHLASLVQQLEETVNMAILDGDRATYVAQVPSAQSMRMFTEIGRRVHTHASGVGKALLAELDPDRVRGITERAGMPTPTRMTLSTVDDLLADLEVIRQRGFAIDDGEQELGVRCIAITVPNMPTPTAISVSGPSLRVDDDFAARAVPLLARTARLIAAEAQPPAQIR